MKTLKYENKEIGTKKIGNQKNLESKTLGKNFNREKIKKRQMKNTSKVFSFAQNLRNFLECIIAHLSYKGESPIMAEAAKEKSMFFRVEKKGISKVKLDHFNPITGQAIISLDFKQNPSSTSSVRFAMQIEKTRFCNRREFEIWIEANMATPRLPFIIFDALHNNPLPEPFSEWNSPFVHNQVLIREEFENITISLTSNVFTFNIVHFYFSN